MSTVKSRGRSQPIARVLSRLLAVFVIASALLLFVVSAGTAAGQWRFAPILTGSMAPSMPQGSIVQAEPVAVEDLEPGDVLLFNAPIPGKPLVVHRIYDEQVDPDGPVFHTKGDANAAPDVWTIRVRGETAWRVARSVPLVGKAVGLFTKAGLRMAVLVAGVLLALGATLRALWAVCPISWRANNVPGGRSGRRERRARARRARRRALVGLTTGAVFVGWLGAMGLGHAQFTSTPTPPAPALGSGQLPTPTGLTCWWPNATTLTTNWTAVSSGGFATGYDIQRSNTSGSGYSNIGTVTPESTITFTDPAPGPPTLRHYVVAASRGSWDSPYSNQVVSNQCIGAINLVAGTTAGYSPPGDGGPAISARLNTPRGVAVDGAGNVYIADTSNHRIRRVDAATGVISTIAGTGTAGSLGDGGLATSAQLNLPRGVAVDNAGNVYIADTANDRVRKITAATGIISTLAGGGANTACTFNGAALGVSLSAPGGVAVDGAGTVYIADTSQRCVRKVVGATVSPVAGGGPAGNTACTFSGAATSVRLTTPGGVAVDGAGTVYIADTGRDCVRKVVGATVSQVAGGGPAGNTACSFSGLATSVRLTAPEGVAVDAAGRVVIADTNRRCVRMVSGTNVVLVAGAGPSGSTGDNGPAVGARLNAPAALATATSGDIWIADSGNDRVRRVEGAP